MTRQGDAFVGGPENNIEIEREIIVDRLSVVQPEAMELLAGHVGACIHEERRLATAFEREIPELQNIAGHHELDKLCL